MKNSWSKWKIISQKVTSFQATVVLTILYIIFLLPLSFFLRLFFKQVLLGNIHKKNKDTFWIKRKKVHYDISWAKKQ